MSSLPTVLPAQSAFAAPDKGGRCLVPATRHRLQIGDDGLRGLGLLSVQSTPDENALDGFGHVEPGTAQRGIERQDAVLDQPAHHLGGAVSGQVIPDQQHPQGGQILRQGQRLGQPGLPQLSYRVVRFRVQGERRREAGEELGQFLFQPRMKYGIGAAGDPVDTHRPAGGME